MVFVPGNHGLAKVSGNGQTRGNLCMVFVPGNHGRAKVSGNGQTRGNLCTVLVLGNHGRGEVSGRGHTERDYALSQSGLGQAAGLANKVRRFPDEISGLLRLTVVVVETLPVEDRLTLYVAAAKVA